MSWAKRPSQGENTPGVWKQVFSHTYAFKKLRYYSSPEAHRREQHWHTWCEHKGAEGPGLAILDMTVQVASLLIRQPLCWRLHGLWSVFIRLFATNSRHMSWFWSSPTTAENRCREVNIAQLKCPASLPGHSYPWVSPWGDQWWWCWSSFEEKLFCQKATVQPHKQAFQYGFWFSPRTSEPVKNTSNNIS